MDVESNLKIHLDASLSFSVNTNGQYSLNEIQRLLELYLLIPAESREYVLSVLGGMASGCNIDDEQKLEKIRSILLSNKTLTK